MKTTQKIKINSFISVSFYEYLLNQHIPESYCLILNDLDIPSSQNHVIQHIIDQFTSFHGKMRNESVSFSMGHLVVGPGHLDNIS